MTTRRKPKAKENQSSTVGRYVAGYTHNEGVSGLFLQMVGGSDMNAAKALAEEQAPKGYALSSLFAQCWPNAEPDADEDDKEPEED